MGDSQLAEVLLRDADLRGYELVAESFSTLRTQTSTITMAARLFLREGEGGPGAQ